MKKIHLKISLFFVLWLLVCLNFLCAEPSSLKNVPSSPAELSPIFEQYGFHESDFALPYSEFLDHSLLSLPPLFARPTTTFSSATIWLDGLDSTSLKGTYFQAATMLDPKFTPVFLAASQPLDVFNNSPIGLEPLLQALDHSLQISQIEMLDVLNSVSLKGRSDFLSLYGLSDEPETGAEKISSLKRRQKYEAMKPYDLNGLLTIGGMLLDNVDATVDALSQNISTLQKTSFQRHVWERPYGKIVLASGQDDVYTATDMENVSLLIDLGGQNRYDASPAAGKNGSIRIVIDLGEQVTIATRTHAASGIFGIGIMVLPNPNGEKNLNTDSFSQGMGLAGIGILSVAGPTTLQLPRYGQGAGSFGIGILKIQSGDKSVIRAERSAQGLGLAKGIGVFIHEGSHSHIQGGLVQPDPREPLGSVSLCQGVGFGPRAYAGGGIGAAIIKGDHNRVMGSYFAQGVGYWHALGLFRYVGNHSLLQSRRYDLGSGVHYALGHFQLNGSQNRILNWGVGPAYGWDNSLGSAFITGKDNEIQVDWGAGAASINSLSFSIIEGEGHKLQLPDWGNGDFFRNSHSYSFHRLKGKGHHVRYPIKNSKITSFPLRTTPWGEALIENASFHPDLRLTPPEWPTLQPEQGYDEESLSLPRIYQEAKKLSDKKRIPILVDVASAFSTDKQTPQLAIQDLLDLNPSSVRWLADYLDPTAVDQMIRLRVILPSYGNTAAHMLLKSYRRSSTHKKLVILSTLSLFSAEKIMPFMEKILKNKDPRFQLNAARSLSSLYNRDTGNEPGVRGMLDLLKKSFEKNSFQSNSELIGGLSRLRWPDAYSLLSRLKPLTSSERKTLFSAGPEDITTTVGEPVAELMLKILNSDPLTCHKNLISEDRLLSQSEEPLRQYFFSVLESTHTRLQAAALVGLGQIGSEEDVSVLAAFLENKNPFLRSAAVTGLCRIKEKGSTPLLELFKSTRTIERITAVSALAHALDPALESLFFNGLHDPDPFVRSLTLAHINRPPPIFEPKRDEWIKKAKDILRYEKEEAIKLTLQQLAQ